MIEKFKTLGEFWRIFSDQTPTYDKWVLGSGAGISGGLMTLSNIATVIGILVGVITIAATIPRAIMAWDELRYRREKRRREDS